MTTHPTPAVWIEGDQLHEAIAAAVYEQCDTHPELALTVDDPRNIAAVAAAVARQLLGTGEQADAVAAPARVGRCAVMFEGGGRCEKDADHRAGRWSDDPHTPEPTPAEETTR